MRHWTLRHRGTNIFSMTLYNLINVMKGTTMKTLRPLKYEIDVKVLVAKTLIYFCFYYTY